MTSRSIATIFNDAALDDEQKAAEISFFASHEEQRREEYTKFKSDTGDRLDELKRELDPLLFSKLLNEIENIAERIMEDGLAEDESDDHAHSLRDFEERVAHERSACLGIEADLAPVEAAYKIMQAVEKTMSRAGKSMREETALALSAIESRKKEFAKAAIKQQDASDAIGMAWNMLHDVRDHHRRENDKIELREYLDGGLSTERPVSAPTPARFRR